MSKDQKIHKLEDIEFKIIYSRRRTIGISVLPDSSVIVRVPYLTSLKTIDRLVNEKYSWVLKHRDNYRKLNNSSLNRSYTTGETHLFRGKEFLLKVVKSDKSFIRFYDSDNLIEIGTNRADDAQNIKRSLYKGYKNEALILFPELLSKVLMKNENQMFKPAGLTIRTMKRRWGSCSGKGIITLSTELIKLSDLYIEYVIAHELCHLKHHNHGSQYYKLLAEVCPEWKKVRKELRKYIR
jgi:predicted metal-dependent hydrolase